MSKLALLGGPALRTKPYPAWPQYHADDLKAIDEVLKSGRWGGNYGAWPTCIGDDFAKEFAAFHDAKYGIPCMNGTIALEVALIAAGIGYGDEVIVPAVTFAASATSILFADALPVFADIEYDTLCISPASVEKLITKNTKAIMPVHLGGVMADLDALGAICKKHNLVMVQDAAHAHGCQWNGKGIGAYGDYATFSFQNLKLLTPGEAGTILTNNEAFMEYCRAYVNCGRPPAGAKHIKAIIGSNLRLTEVQAALLKGQFSRYPAQMAKRIENATKLTAQLRQIDGITPIVGDERQTRIPYYRYAFHYESAQFAGASRTAFIKAMRAEGIPLMPEAGQPVYRSPLFAWRDCRWKRLYGDRLDYSAILTPVAEKVSTQTACRFMHEVLLSSADDVADIVRAIEKIKCNREELSAWVDPDRPEVITRG